MVMSLSELFANQLIKEKKTYTYRLGILDMLDSVR